MNDAVTRRHVDNAIGFQRSGDRIGDVKIEKPLQTELADTARVYLLKRTKVILAKGPAVGRPVGTICFVGQHFVVDRQSLSSFAPDQCKEEAGDEASTKGGDVHRSVNSSHAVPDTTILPTCSFRSR